MDTLRTYREALKSERDEIIRAMDVRETTTADIFRYIGRLAKINEVIKDIEVILENEGGSSEWGM